jgi:hypothetical protein
VSLDARTACGSRWAPFFQVALPGQLSGKIRTSSFLGLMAEFVVVAADVELRAIRAWSGLQATEVDLTIRREHCIVLAETAVPPAA